MKINAIRKLTPGFAGALLLALTVCRLRAAELSLGTNLPPVDFHGLLSQGFLYSGNYNYLGETKEGSFAFTELGLNASMSPFPRTRISAQAFSFDVGREGNYEPVLDYASLEYTVNDYLGFRGGRIRRPHGIYTHIVDIDTARTWILLPQGMYDARWRDFLSSLDGGEIFGSASLGEVGGLEYEAYSGLARPTTSGGLAHFIENGLPPGSNVKDLSSPTIAGAQLWWHTPVDGFRTGLAYERVFNFQPTLQLNLGFPVTVTSDPTPIDIWQGSLDYTWHNWTLQAEYWRQEIHGGAGSAIPDSWYASAAYRFNKRFEAGAYYTEFYNTIRDRDGTTLPVRSDGYQKDAAMTLRFDPSDRWTFKVEEHYIRGTALLRDDIQNPVRDDKGWWMTAVKATFSF